MATKMDELLAKLTAETDLITAVAGVVTGLSQQVRDLLASGASAAEIQAALDLADAHATQLAAAVVAGTPAG